jgi:hypothetical protein
MAAIARIKVNEKAIRTDLPEAPFSASDELTR